MADMVSAKATWVSVGGAERRTGERTEGFLKLASAPDKELGSPVVVVSGVKPGPTIWVQACVHGTEVGGIAGINRFLAGLDPQTLSGTIVAVMTANPAAYLAQTRNTPVDGENLNRVFPGGPGQGHTRQIADGLLGEATAVADVIVDLHSGGDRSHVPLYALCWADGSPAAARAEQLATAADVPWLWPATDSWLSGSMMARATQAGIPTLIVECGGAGQVPDAHVHAFAQSLRSIAAAVGLLSEEPVSRLEGRMDRCTLVYNRTGGLFRSFVGPGDIVDKDQPLGEVHDLTGHVIETIIAPVGPSFIAAIRKTWAAVPSGEMIAECVLTSA